MYLPQFLVGMFVTSTIVAVWTCAVTDWVWTALGWAIIDLVVLQVGYFVLVIRLVSKGATAVWRRWRPRSRRTGGDRHAPRDR